jgi:hypothetical protein
VTTITLTDFPMHDGLMGVLWAALRDHFHVPVLVAVDQIHGVVVFTVTVSALEAWDACELYIDPLHIAWTVTAERPGIVTERGQGAPNVGGLAWMDTGGFGLAQEGAA